MCGIAGYVSRAPLLDDRLVDAMSLAVAHRGPDGSGKVVRPHAALAHRRLAIVDVAGGAQPLANEDGSVWITYNGEVYNHLALRARLEGRGHRFRTRSDTEVIVHGYEDDGPACVRRLRGMFAFGLWDEPRRRLVLARDRLGIKPLYYARIGGDLLFASDLRALLICPEVDRTLDEDALACYLALRYVPAPATLVRGVRKLPPASLLVWQDGEVRVERYWDLLDGTGDDHAALQQDGAGRAADPLAATAAKGAGFAVDPATGVEAAAHLRERIDEAVELRLMSEVPLGAFLSGGLDSTMVSASMLAAAARQPGALALPLRTFAVGYDGSEAESAASELGWAALAAHALGTTHREVHVRAADAVAALPRIVGDLDEPVADPAAVPLWFLARRAREEVTVVLSGEGGDELFAGYGVYRTMRRLETLRSIVGGGVAGALALALPGRRLRRAFGLASRPLHARYRGVCRGLDLEGPSARVLLGAAEARRVEDAVQGVLEPIWDATRGLSPLRRMLYLDLRVWLPDELLVKADKITMASAVELRVPLLDHPLVEYAWGLPDRLKLEEGWGGSSKLLLRSAARGRVPHAILGRPKLGFATPTAAWLRGPLMPLVRAALFDTESLALDRFGRASVERLVERHRLGTHDHAAELWALLVLELWRGRVRRIAPLQPVAAAEVR